MDAVVHRVGQLYDFHLNMWQFTSSPQGLGGAPEAPKALTGAPTDGGQQTHIGEQEKEAVQLPQFVQPGVYRQFGGSGDEQLHAAAAAASPAAAVPTTSSAAAVAAEQQQQH
ncbi:transcriptional co-activator ADA2-A, putative [Eimeria praecox]|uniref:Transcriptional co-activator ADA2-A, putative n=1 Tax=Eimeria praecox TaxID=51316 RepID=U6G5I3_9EIME|nr:transcriptional co-activator ADA2-A, putative [Eimeria praecox]